jgi:hypothetical protein
MTYELWTDVERDLIHNAIHQQMSAMLPIEVERQLTGRLGAWTICIEQLQREIAALKAQMHRQIDDNSLFDTTTFLHSRTVLPSPGPASSSPLSFESTTTTTSQQQQQQQQHSIHQPMLSRRVHFHRHRQRQSHHHHHQ